ncbi:hypothetical protein T484DRAFT_2286928 [Baffinella frigidus]|nr:hypothetical protein T484DRAFT_2286928 [Cryptophyta sp. CCMP2293]
MAVLDKAPGLSPPTSSASSGGERRVWGGASPPPGDAESSGERKVRTRPPSPHHLRHDSSSRAHPPAPSWSLGPP